LSRPREWGATLNRRKDGGRAKVPFQSKAEGGGGGEEFGRVQTIRTRRTVIDGPLLQKKGGNKETITQTNYTKKRLFSHPGGKTKADGGVATQEVSTNAVEENANKSNMEGRW